MTGYTPGIENQKVLKVSLGAEKNLNLLRKKRILPLIKKLKKEGFYIVSLEQSEKAIPFYKFKPKKKMAIILGNEVEGLNKKILNLSDKIVEIPKLGKVKESLNVAIAFSIFASYLTFKDKLSKTI